MPIVVSKVIFSAALDSLIGIYYFKNLIPDEELIILKAELQLYRNHNFYAEISPHVVNASSARHLVYVKILQAAQVVLISTVGKVLARKIEREKALAVELHVGSCVNIQ